MEIDSRIEDYLLIGGLRTGALVSNTGSIDWLCLPYFDSPSIFAQLLDPSGGSFSIDASGFTTSSHYVPDTAIAELILTSPEAEISLRDFMEPQEQSDLTTHQYIVRKLTCLKGSTSLTFKFDVKPNYARSKISWQQKGNELFAAYDKGWLVLHTPSTSKINKNKNGFNIELSLSKGQVKQLVLEYQPVRQSDLKPPDNLEHITLSFWKDWVAKGNYVDFCRDNLVRSAITLKLMQFAPTGAIVAAPTTSLPEAIGGVRNWDYRYVWIRDATFTLYAFRVLGYTEEAERFFDFIHDIIEHYDDEQFDISLMYTIFGKLAPSESTLDHFEGYAKSKPVRIGNDAASQFQLDVYGSLIDAVYFATKRGIKNEHKGRNRKLVINLVNKIDQVWRHSDSGIWEVRSSRQQFTYSKVMSWVGAERAARLKDILGFSDEETALCHNLASDIKDWIWQNSYLKEDKNLSQYPGTKAVDATNFLLVLLQFLNKHDPKTKEIINNTQRELCHQEAFVYRYLSNDGLPGKEGAFVLCSFWLISALAIVEDVAEATRLFEKIETFLAPNGLISEEIDVETGKYLGNYPQAFSHVGYIMSAHYLSKYQKRSNLKNLKGTK